MGSILSDRRAGGSVESQERFDRREDVGEDGSFRRFWFWSRRMAEPMRRRAAAAWRAGRFRLRLLLAPHLSLLWLGMPATTAAAVGGGVSMVALVARLLCVLPWRCVREARHVTLQNDPFSLPCPLFSSSALFVINYLADCGHCGPVAARHNQPQTSPRRES